MIGMSQAFKPKSYLKPSSVEETCELLTKYGERARIISGGTGIYEVAHRGLLSEVECLVDLTALSLDQIKIRDFSLDIGATTTMSKMMDSNQLSQLKEMSVLVDALKVIQPLQVKNVATIGGAICTALPFFDLPVALITLDASVRIAPKDRIEKVSEFIRGYFSIDLGLGEFVTEIIVPLADKKDNVGSAFQKFALTGDDWALVNCGAYVKLDHGEISILRLCFGGGVGEKPKRVRKTEKLLEGVKATDENRIKSVLDENLSNDLETISDIRASSEYRFHLSKVLGRRSILLAGRRALESTKIS
jgi:CO/xanthine dehydrogenase FAD-binding subunit